MSVLELAAAPWRHRWRVRVLAIIVVSVALEAALLAGGILRSFSGSSAVSGLPPGVGQPVRTGFGAIVVQSALTTTDGASGALAADGVDRLAAPPGDVWVVVSAALTNLKAVAQPYGASLFRLRLGRSGVGLAPSRTSSDGVALPPISASERLLGFLVPQSHPDLWLEFDDGGPAHPVLIGLGRVGRLPHGMGTGPAHDHEEFQPNGVLSE